MYAPANNVSYSWDIKITYYLQFREFVFPTSKYEQFIGNKVGILSLIPSPSMSIHQCRLLYRLLTITSCQSPVFLIMKLFLAMCIHFSIPSTLLFILTSGLTLWWEWTGKQQALRSPVKSSWTNCCREAFRPQLSCRDGEERRRRLAQIGKE